MTIRCIFSFLLAASIALPSAPVAAQLSPHKLSAHQLFAPEISVETREEVRRIAPRDEQLALRLVMEPVLGLAFGALGAAAFYAVGWAFVQGQRLSIGTIVGIAAGVGGLGYLFFLPLGVALAGDLFGGRSEYSEALLGSVLGALLQGALTLAAVLPDTGDIHPAAMALTISSTGLPLMGAMITYESFSRPRRLAGPSTGASIRALQHEGNVVGGLFEISGQF